MTTTRRARKIFAKVAVLSIAFTAGAFFGNLLPGPGQAMAADTHKVLQQESLWKAQKSRNKIVVVSDLHFGVDDKFAENVQNRPRFVEFLQRLQKTKDVRELVIDGDFVDEWFLPLDYGPVQDFSQFFLKVVKNNQSVFDELNKTMASGIKVVYVIGNHDMNLPSGFLSKVMPGLVEIHDTKGMGRYITGDRNEIVIEHSHRYDPYSAPDMLTNKELCNSEDTMYPPGYFYARMGTSWVVENRPKISKNYPVLSKVPQATDTDQMNAYIYAKTLENLFKRITEKSNFTDKVFKVATCGFKGSYSLQDMYPVEQPDGTISAPVLFRNFQRTWDERQKINDVWVKIPFQKAGANAGSAQYYSECATEQYLKRTTKPFDVVVFGHTHMPDYQSQGTKVYVNSGTWVDHNSDFPAATRTFVVVETNRNKDKTSLYMYKEDGSLRDLSKNIPIK